jgi:hypothetical protein
MFEVIYLFVDGLAERLHLGQPREAVLTLRLQLRLRLLTGCAIVSPRERKGLGRSSACRVRNRTARKGRRQPRPLTSSRRNRPSRRFVGSSGK